MHFGTLRLAPKGVPKDADSIIDSDLPSFLNPVTPMLNPPYMNPSSVKRPGTPSDARQSKRPMYCRNAYMIYLVRKLVASNPYVSLQSVLHILDDRHIEFKEVTVSKFLAKERAQYLTPMKDLVNSFKKMRNRRFVLPS